MGQRDAVRHAEQHARGLREHAAHPSNIELAGWPRDIDQFAWLRERHIADCVRRFGDTDSAVGAWNIKYLDNLWRPITAIHDCSGWNSFFTTCDPTWTSTIVTP